MRKRKDEEEKNVHEIVVETVEPDAPEEDAEDTQPVEYDNSKPEPTPEEPESEPEAVEVEVPVEEVQATDEPSTEANGEYIEVETDDPESILEEDLTVPLVLEGDVGTRMKKLEEHNLRLRAEFANYKRRIERENIEFAGYLKGEIIKELLPVFDDFRLMIEKSTEGDNEQTLLEGAKMIYGKLTGLLVREGLQKIEALGTEFDPNIHEALMMRPIDNEDEHDKVVEVFQDGFTLNDKLLRPSKVVVGKFEGS